MELRFVMLWRYFSQTLDTDNEGNQCLYIKVRALSPMRRKVVDHLGAWLSILCIVLLSIEIIPLVLDEIQPFYMLLIIPAGGTISYAILIAFFILFLRKTKAIIINGECVSIRKYMFLWARFDRTRQLAIIEKSYSPLSNKKLADELLSENLSKREQSTPSKPYYKHSRKLIIEHRGIPYALLPIYDVGLAEQIRCRLQAALDDIPVGAHKKITESPSDIWGYQAGDLTDAS